MSTPMTLPFTHDRTLCQCRGCERIRRSQVRTVVSVTGPWIVAGVCIGYLLIHVLIWIVKGFPGLMRIG